MRSPGREHILLLLLMWKRTYSAPSKSICCGFQPLSGISLQPRIEHFVSLSSTEMASHHDHQHSFWLAQADPWPAEFHHSPCFKVPLATSALQFFWVKHILGPSWAGDGISVPDPPMPLPTSPRQLLPLLNVKKLMKSCFFPVRISAKFGLSLGS